MLVQARMRVDPALTCVCAHDKTRSYTGKIVYALHAVSVGDTKYRKLKQVRVDSHPPARTAHRGARLTPYTRVRVFERTLAAGRMDELVPARGKDVRARHYRGSPGRPAASVLPRYDAHRAPRALCVSSWILTHRFVRALAEKLVKVSLPIALGAQAMSAKRANLLTAFKVLQNQCELEVDDAWIDGSVQPSVYTTDPRGAKPSCRCGICGGAPCRHSEPGLCVDHVAARAPCAQVFVPVPAAIGRHGRGDPARGP